MKKVKSLVSSIILGLLAMVLFMPQAGAVVSENIDRGSEMTVTNSEEEQPTRTGGTRNVDNSNNIKVNSAKLDATKLKLCQNREKVINNVMLRVKDRSEKQLAVFERISQRVQEFYVSKGYQIANYDDLVANINSYNQNVRSMVQNMSNVNQNFDCASDDPKSMINNFKDSESSRLNAMKDYKSSINELLVSVKSAAESQLQDNSEVEQ